MPRGYRKDGTKIDMKHVRAARSGAGPNGETALEAGRLNKHQTNVMLAIQKHHDRTGKIPSGQMLVGALGRGSPAGYSLLLTRLQKAGFIWRVEGKGARAGKILKRMDDAAGASLAAADGLSEDTARDLLKAALAALSPFAKVGQGISPQDKDEDFPILVGPQRVANEHWRKAAGVRNAVLLLLAQAKQISRPSPEEIERGESAKRYLAREAGA